MKSSLRRGGEDTLVCLGAEYVRLARKVSRKLRGEEQHEYTIFLSSIKTENCINHLSGERTKRTAKNYQLQNLLMTPNEPGEGGDWCWTESQATRSEKRIAVSESGRHFFFFVYELFTIWRTNILDLECDQKSSILGLSGCVGLDLTSTRILRTVFGELLGRGAKESGGPKTETSPHAPPRLLRRVFPSWIWRLGKPVGLGGPRLVLCEGFADIRSFAC